jgi:hypothetical protein
LRSIRVIRVPKTGSQKITTFPYIYPLLNLKTMPINHAGPEMRTTLFNLHEIPLEQDSLTIEFYAGDIFDIHTDILVLSAFRGGFHPVPGTTWGSLADRAGFDAFLRITEAEERHSANIVTFRPVPNPLFHRLVALEMAENSTYSGFTLATLQARYRELGLFLEAHPAEYEQSVSLPLMGTGNQKIALEDSVTELLKMLNSLKQTNLRIIRVFANHFASVGVLNRKINALLHRREAGPSHLLEAALREITDLRGSNLSALSAEATVKIIDLSIASHNSLDSFGTAGRHFAEKVTAHWLEQMEFTEILPTLNARIKQVEPMLLSERPYVYSYLRLLQNYGNQVSHYGNRSLTHQDAAAIVIAMARIIDFHENK